MYLTISREVKNAVEHNKPVVALESTIISHGMPYPQNVQCALSLEDTVRAQGAVPATIAVIDGNVRVGLDKEEIIYLATAKDVKKLSRRDLGWCIAKHNTGATTVSATMIIAKAAGIEVFATGGIGGVHRQGEVSMDISADLEELAKTPVMVVCSGVKSILDIGRTLEYLETKGVCVAGYKTDIFPAFYSVNSGYNCDCNVDEAEAAKIFLSNENLGMRCGMLVAVPVPCKYEMDKKIIDEAIEQALTKAATENITGKAITPYLLAQVSNLTEGKSLETNIQLVKNNALVAAKIAVELSCRKQGEGNR